MAINPKNTAAPELFHFEYSDNNELTLSFRGKGTPFANLQLFDDKNKNGVKDADEQRSAIVIVDNQGNWKLDVKVGQLTANSNFAIRSVENNDSNISEITSLTYTQPLPVTPAPTPVPVPTPAPIPEPIPVPAPQISITRNVGDIAETNVLALTTFPTAVTYNVSQGTPNGEVQLANSGSAKVGSDLQFSAINLSVISSDINNQTAVIKLDGQGNASFNLTALADDLVEGDETIAISVSDPAKQNSTATAAAIVTVHDLTTPPPPRITRDQSQISEPTFGQGSATSIVTQVVYTVSGQANTIINLSNKGSAIIGEDVQFTALSGIWSDGNIAQQTGSVKLNDKGQASFSLTAVSDTKIEGDENLLVSISDGKQTASSDAVLVRDFVTPLSITSNIQEIFEPTSQASISNPSQVTYTITGAPNQLVALRNTGAAKIGEDLTALPVSFEWLNPDLIQQSANIRLNNQGSATFTLVALSDKLTEGDESISLSIADVVNPGLNNAAPVVTLHDTTQRTQLQITANQSTITETTGSNSVVYTIKGGTANATVNLTNTGSASVGADTLETSSSSIQLNAQGEATFNLTAVADKITEGDENIVITAVDAQDSTNKATAQTVIIRDTSQSSSQLQISANQKVISEIADAASPNQVKYTITGGAPNATVDISNTGTANLGIDTNQNSNSIKLDAKGEATFSLTAVADKISEGDENIVITVADTQDATNKATAAAVLINDTSRSLLQITADQTAIYELAGTNSPTQVNYKITGGTPNSAVNLNNSGNAIIGTDTNSLPAIKLDAKGEASFSLTAVADNIAEGNENLLITVSDAQEPLNIAAAPSVVIHDTPALNFNVSNPSIFDEGTGNNPAKVAQLTVELSSPPPSQAVTVFWSTKDGTAIGATGSVGATGATGATSSVGAVGATGSFDYQATINGQLTFAPGETSKTINIPLVGDSAIESDENFSVVLSNPSANAILGPLSTQTVTIKNDDTLPTLRFAASSVTASQFEGNFSVATVSVQPANKATLTVELTAASDQPVSISYATKDGTATSPAITTELPRDYIAASGIISFAPGETTKTVDIQFVPDANFEQDETFSVLLSNLIGNATLGTANTATVTIKNDDQSPVASFSQTAISITEGNSGDTIVQVPIRLSAESFQPVIVQYTTSDGTAKGTNSFFPGISPPLVDPADYRPISNGSFTFQPGETTGFINIAVIGDTLIENNENFTISLIGVNNNVGTPNSAVVTINNDDQQIIG